MNAGDVFADSNVLQSVSGTLATTSATVVYGDVRVVKATGSKVRKGSPIGTITRKIPFCHQSVFVRTQEARKRPFHREFSIAADYDFFYYLYWEKGATAFAYVPITISEIDAIHSLTYQQKTRCKREYLLIRAAHKDLRWYYDAARMFFKTGKIFPPKA